MGYTLLEDNRKRVGEAVDFYGWIGYPCQPFSPAGCQRGNDGDSASALMCGINWIFKDKPFFGFFLLEEVPSLATDKTFS